MIFQTQAANTVGQRALDPDPGSQYSWAESTRPYRSCALCPTVLAAWVWVSCSLPNCIGCLGLKNHFTWTINFNYFSPTGPSRHYSIKLNCTDSISLLPVYQSLSEFPDNGIINDWKGNFYLI